MSGIGQAEPLLASSRWRRVWTTAAVALLVVWVGIAFLYRDTVVVMVGVWSSSETFTHAFGVPLISAWLVWRRRSAILVMSPRPWPWALLPMVLLVLLWLAGDLMLVNVVTQFALVGLFVLTFPLLLGLQVTRAMMFPLGFLFFAVPFGDFLIPAMMEWTANFTVAALQLSGIPVYREGSQFVIPSGNWSVVEACSGIRYLIASLMVGTLFAYLNYRSMWRRWVFVCVAIVVPVVANWLRAYMIVMIGHLSNNKLAVGVDHLIYGWLFFGLVIGFMFMVGARWAEPEDEPTPAAARSSLIPAARKPWAAALAALCAIAVAPLLSQYLRDADRQATQPRLELPRSLAGEPEVSKANQPLDWAPNFQNPRVSGHAVYGEGNAAIGLYVAYFRDQDYQSKLVNSMHALIKGESSAWNLRPVQDVRAIWHSRALDLQTAYVSRPPRLAQSAEAVLLVARAYWIDGDFVTSPALAKLLNAWAKLRGRGDDGALVVLAVAGADGVDLRDRLQQVVAAALPELDAVLDAVREKR